MYLPEHFAERDAAALLDLVNSHPLGILITNAPSGLDANHIPFEVEADLAPGGRLRAHVARNNPVWQEASADQQVLVIFRGADAYISPNWFPSKHELHRQVPTWNYRVVHVHGVLRIRDDEKYVRGIVGRLTRRHEEGTRDPRPWKMSDSEPEYINKMIEAIVGIEVEITKVEGKFKLSQNKDERDRSNVADQLRKRGLIEVADGVWNTQTAGDSGR